MRNLRRLRVLAVLAALGLAAVACGGGAANSTTAGSTASSPASGTISTSPAVPNPFTVIARYSASSLGLRLPVSAGTAVGPDGDLYVTDSSQRVTVISPLGKVVRQWGTPGSAPGQFHFVSYDPTDPTQLNAGVAVGPDGQVYVVDSGNNRIELFSPHGRFIRSFGDTGQGQLRQPNDIAVDAAGDVFVTDVGGITKFSPTGGFDWTIGGSGAADPDLAGHLHLANVDAHGRLVATAEEAKKVVYLDENGHKVDSFGVGNVLAPSAGACSVTVDASGDAVVEDCGLPQNTLLVYDRTHLLVGAWPDCHLLSSPRFGRNEELFALREDGTILELKAALPGA